MRLFSLSSSRGDKSSKRKSTSTSTSSKRSSSQSFASAPVLQAPIVMSESRWNASGQQVPHSQPAPPRTQHQPDNKSTTNLSSTSTLLDDPLPHSRPPPAPNSYEEFIARAQAAEARQRQMAYAWQKAEERRANCKSLASDPWRGGFGPVSSGRRERRDGGGKGMGLSPKREGVRGWLSGNGLVGR